MSDLAPCGRTRQPSPVRPAGTLGRPPLQRALRGSLEAAHCAHELRLILGDIRALRIKSRDLRALLDAGLLTATDLAAEVDEIGLALGQLEIVGRPAMIDSLAEAALAY